MEDRVEQQLSIQPLPVPDIVEEMILRAIVYEALKKRYENQEAKLIEQKISSKTKAILLTDMYGQSCDIDSTSFDLPFIIL